MTAARLSLLQAESHSLKEIIGLLEAIVTTAQDAMCASVEERYADENVEGVAIITPSRTLRAGKEAPARDYTLHGEALNPYGSLSCTPEMMKIYEMPSVEDATNELGLWLPASGAAESRQQDGGLKKTERKKGPTEFRRTRRSVVLLEDHGGKCPTSCADQVRSKSPLQGTWA